MTIGESSIVSEAEHFQRMMALFEQACALPAAKRATFVAEHSSGDPRLCDAVLAMLSQDEAAQSNARTDGRADARTDALLGSPGIGQQLLARAIATSDDHRDRRLGHDRAGDDSGGERGSERGADNGDSTHDDDRFDDRSSAAASRLPVLAGHYRIIKVLGEGGMGIVYLAEQARPRRLVAMKAIRPGMASRNMLRRFEHEAQVLGRLQHPGIAQIYEAGAADEVSPDQAYFAMEYVAGPPLQEFADGRALDVRQRVQLMIRVCDAVHHAHQRGIIHRDLKPNNIHVEADGQPKVLDFGVARFAADGDGDHHTTMHTQAGQIIGTLAYMSPEQVAGDSDAVDVRSDVYAVGVMLYQLLGRQLPLDLGRSGLVEAARMIREVDPPRLGAIDRSLRGDLETIVARALEKDRERRYQSAADLRDDLQRHLDGLPINARQDSAIYVMRRLLRRHRPLVAACMLALVALVAFAAYASAMATRNRELASRERIAREQADAVSRNLSRELNVSSIERGRMAGKTGSLVPAEQFLWSAYGRDPKSRHVHWALWELYSRLPCRTTLDTQVANMAAMSRSDDGELLALAGAPARVEIRSAVDFTIRHVLTTAGANATVVAFSPDNRTLVTGDDGGALTLWNVADWSKISEFAGDAKTPQAVRSIAWSPQGDRLAWTTNDFRLHLWSLDERDPPRSFAPKNVRALPGGMSTVAFAPDGRTLAWFGVDQHVRLASVDAPDEYTLILTGHVDRVFTLQFADGGRTLYTGSTDRDVRVWNLADGKCLATMSAPNGFLRSIRLSRDERTLAVIGWWTLDLWDVASRTRLRSIPIPLGAAAFDWSKDERTIVTAHSDGSLREWDLAPETFAEYADNSGRCAAAISRDGALIAIGDAEGAITVRERESGSTLWTANVHGRRIHAVQFTNDGRLLLSAGLDANLRLWDARSGEMLGAVSGIDANSIDSASFSNDGKRIVVGWRDLSYHVLSVPDLKPLKTFGKGKHQTLAVRFSDDDTRIVTTSREKVVRVWDADANEIAALTLTETPWVSRFSPDGKRLAIGTWGKNVELWDIATASRIATLDGHNGLVSGVAFGDAASGLVASAAADGAVRLWDVDDPRNLLILDAFEVEAITVDLSADGRWMVAAGADGRVKVWDLRRFDPHIEGNRAHHLK